MAKVRTGKTKFKTVPYSREGFVKVVASKWLWAEIGYRELGVDQGFSIEIWAMVHDSPRQVLRFDPLENDPHYHYDPTVKDRTIPIEPAIAHCLEELDGFNWEILDIIDDVIPTQLSELFCLIMIKYSLQPMLTDAGYPDLGKKANNISTFDRKIERALIKLKTQLKQSAKQ